MEFNEQAAIDYIRTKLPADSAQRYDDDEILNVIDIVWDYYDEHGMLNIDAEGEDDELDMDALKAYARKMIAKDRNSPLTPEDVEAIVEAEIAYEDTIF